MFLKFVKNERKCINNSSWSTNLNHLIKTLTVPLQLVPKFRLTYGEPLWACTLSHGLSPSPLSPPLSCYSSLSLAYSLGFCAQLDAKASDVKVSL